MWQSADLQNHIVHWPLHQWLPPEKLVHPHQKTTRHLDSVAPGAAVVEAAVVLAPVAVVTVALSTKWVM